MTECRDSPKCGEGEIQKATEPWTECSRNGEERQDLLPLCGRLGGSKSQKWGHVNDLTKDGYIWMGRDRREGRSGQGKRIRKYAENFFFFFNYLENFLNFHLHSSRVNVQCNISVRCTIQ